MTVSCEYAEQKQLGAVEQGTSNKVELLVLY